ncbi:tail completion protein gp17 [Algoriphagus sp. PAP.12]|uniref:tail completion protein gp17 n=1 Tax=Algoriphagus sp. PAP.12 TaxID=2996678 RepID=UPI00227BCCDD|nr:DUF3168 domain-containing protein [Algoriphagus sp. PAP.12]
MKVEEIVYQLLSTNPDITNEVLNQIYPLRIAQGKQLPFIAYTVKSVEPNGGKKEKSEFDSYFIDVDVFSDKYSQVNSLADLVRDAFEAVTYEGEDALCEFDFLSFREDYKNDAQLFNRTVGIIGLYKK